MKMSEQTLRCLAGNHDYIRPLKRGRVPVNCPEHSNTPQAKAIQEPSKARIATITEIINHRGEGCSCQIYPEISDRELMRGALSCSPHWVCSTLDKVRRMVVDYS